MRAQKIFTYDIDLDGNRLLNAVLYPVADFSLDPEQGQIENKNGVLYIYHDGAWKILGAQVGNFQGGFDADTEVQLPAGSIKGDYWWVTVAGTVNALFSPALSVGTMIVSGVNGADPLDITDWVVMRMGGGAASFDEYGLIKLATVLETQTGTDNEKAVTPVGLAGMKASDLEANDPTENKRFITPRGLFEVIATEEQMGLVRFATSVETGAGIRDDVGVTPKGLKDNTIVMELKNIHEAELMRIKLVADDLSVWKVTVDNLGNLQTELNGV